MMLFLGVDDAGRGPLIGPMVLAGVLLNEKQEAKLKRYKVRDSKTIHNSLMGKFAELVKKNSIAYKIVLSAPEEIDKALDSEINLNILEAIKTAEIINALNVGKIKKQKIKLLVDCPSHNAFSWRTILMEKICYIKNLEVHCEHKADKNYIATAAASILAKDTREREVSKLKEKYGELGSGYSHDSVTIKFLKEKGKELRNEKIFRRSWETWKKIFPAEEKGQKTLGDFNINPDCP